MGFALQNVDQIEPPSVTIQADEPTSMYKPVIAGPDVTDDGSANVLNVIPGPLRVGAVGGSNFIVIVPNRSNDCYIGAHESGASFNMGNWQVDSGSGFLIGIDDSAGKAKFFFGNSGADNADYDGATLAVTGTISVTGGNAVRYVAGVMEQSDGTDIDLDDLKDSATYGRVQIGSLDGGYVDLLRMSADTTERLLVTASGIEGYANNVKNFELASGIGYFGDQANEHVKVSASGTQIYDGATLYATYGATTTIGLTASEHILVSGTAVQFKDGATVYTELAAGTLILGDVANEHVRVTAADGVELKDGANIYGAFAATTTLGDTGTEHIEITAAHVQFKDGADTFTDLAAGVLVIGKVGANLSNVEITGGALNLRTNEEDIITLSNAGVVGITVKSGGGITLEGGGDILMQGNDANPSSLSFEKADNVKNLGINLAVTRKELLGFDIQPIE